MGNFRPVKQLIVAVVHIRKNIFGIDCTFGITADSGIGECNAEIHHIHNNLNEHDSGNSQRGIATAFAKGFLISNQLLPVCFFGGTQQNRIQESNQVQQEENQIEGDKYRVGSAIGTNKDAEGKNAGKDNLP